MPALPLTCHIHPQRPGIGICVACRQVICAECTTPMDGVNRCARCIAALVKPVAEVRTLREWGPLSLIGAAGSLGILWLLFRQLARAFLPS